MQHQPVDANLKFCPHCNREYDQQGYYPPVKPFGDFVYGVALVRCTNPDCVNCGHPHYIPVHPEIAPQKVVLA